MSLNSENSVVIKTEVLDDSEYSELPCIALQHDYAESGKRKGNQDGIGEKRLKSMLSQGREIDIPVSTGSSNMCESNLKNCPNIDSEELAHVLEGMSDEIDSMLEATASKNRLTSKHVKSILKHVITNEYVLAMVRNTMKSELNENEELDEAVFEPKLTRSKAKELREKQRVLPWPVASPVKQTESLSKALLEDEFSEESSSDEDYKPVEVECASDEELVSSKVSELDIPSCPPADCEEHAEDELIVEHDEDENRLVIAEADVPLNSEEEDKIALRTRSKLCLNDTPLEAIEASFIAPDITVDMYDTHCDDEEWQKFLCDLYKPLDSEVAVQPSNEEADDPEDDPEYNFLDDDEDLDELDLRYDRKNVKIPRDELSDLMAEIWEASPLDLNDCEEEDENSTYQQAETSCINNICIENVRSQWMNLNERLQLEQQMRMYVQLLVQAYLLSFGVPELNFINVSAKLFLDEIKMFATREIASS
ncbi:GON-4-like protein, partial [Stegodyphus mimosarum]